MKTYKILGNGLFQRSILNSGLIAALFLAVTLSPLAHSHGQDADQSAAVVAATADQKNQAKQLTLQLGNLIAEYKAAGTASSSELANQLTALAEERRQLLGQLIENDPAEVLKQAMPDEVLDQMPAKAQAFLEQHRAMEGEVQLLHVDYKDQSQSHYVYLLSTDTGERYSLHFAKHGPDIQSGARVRVNGVAFYGIKTRDAGETDGAVALDDGTTSLEILAAGGSGSTTTTTATTTSPTVLPNTFGAQKTAVLLVNFQVDQNNKPWTIEQARSMVFGPVSDFFKENSYNQTWLTGDVFGWLTIAVDPTGCPTMDIASAAQKAATDQGIDLSGYGRIVYAFPNIACPYSGEATVGGQPSRVWLDGTLLDGGIVSHELGHNLGLLHSHALDCGSASVGGSCTSEEYGDVLDRMGEYFSGHFSPFQKERLGWLGYGVSPPILAADSDGVYHIEPYAAQTSGAKAIRILRDVNPTTGMRTWYYLEFRKSLGFDSFLSASRYGASALNGLVFRLGTEGDAQSSFLLDMTPNSQAYDWDDMALPAGSAYTYTDAASGVSITLNQIDSTGATVTVNLPAPACARANPTLAITPQSQSGIAGASLTYSLSISNNDDPTCAPASTFNLLAAAPSGWNASFANSALTVNAGSSASTTFTIASPSTAAAASYSTNITASNGTYSGSTSADYSVITALSVAASTDKTSYTRNQTVKAMATVKAGGSPVAGASVMFTITKSNGATSSQNATTDATGTAAISVKLSRKDPTGSYGVKSQATLQTLSGTAQTTFTVM